LYAAERALTCLREVLADLRPNTKALSDFERIFGRSYVGIIPAGEVKKEWREQHVLAKAWIIRSGKLIDVEEINVREQLTRRYARLLKDHGMDHLDLAQVRSDSRVVTQTISRSLFEDGAAGIRFRSKLDDGRCIVIFEGRAVFKPAGGSVPLANDLPELLQVCSEFSLILRK
jgi:hypothetical protein